VKMTKRKRASLGQNLLKLALIAPAILSVTARLFSMARLEISIARRRLVWFFLLGLSCLVLLLGVWTSLCWLLCFYLLSLKLSLIQSMAMVLILNLFLLIIACLCLALCRVDLTFSKTRRDIQK